MLNAMREGAGAHIVKLVALGFVLLATAGMVFMDVGGFFRGGVADTTLASVGRTKIDAAAFERTAANAVRSQNMTLQEAYRFGLLQNLLDEMITTEAMRQEAAREGLVISRGDIARRVHDMVKLQIQPGETAQATLERLLRTQGMTESDLTLSMRQALTAELIDGPLKASVYYVPRLATEAMGRFHAERRDIVFFTLTPENAGATQKPDEETLKAYYEAVKDQFQIPEQRTFKAMVLSADDIKPTIAITDADVKAAFDERKDQFRIGERRRIEQIILADEAKAKAATEAARKGKSMKTVGGKDYKEPSEVEQTGLPTELGAAVFGAEKGTVLNPIRTPLGYHVIRVIDVVPARAQTLKEVQADLRKELESDALHTEMESRIEKIDEALGTGDSLDQIAGSLGLAVRTLGPIDSKGNFTEGQTQDAMLTALAQNKDLLASLFELMEGETGDLAEVNEGLYAVFSLETVRPTHDRDFAEVREQVEKKWMDEQQAAVMNAATDKLMNELSRGEKSFADAAKEAGAVLKTARDVSRESKVAGLNDPVALTRLFDETDLSSVVKVPTENGVIFAKVIDARIPEAGKGKAAPEAEKQWRMQMEQAVIALYAAEVREHSKVKVNEELLQRMYGAEANAQ